MPDSEPPPPGSSSDFPWFEQGPVIVVEGEILASRCDIEQPGSDALLPPRSTC